MNTGHEGGCGTVHANSATAVPDRLAALALAAGMTLAGVHAQVGAGLEVVVHLARQSDGTRVVAELGVVARGVDGTEVRPALVRRGGALGRAGGYTALAERLGGHL
jgi:pilus assembly protein CpaF